MKQTGYTIVLAFALFFVSFVLGQISSERLEKAKQETAEGIIRNANMALKTEKFRCYLRYIDGQVVLTYPPPSLRVIREKAMAENISYRYQ